MKKPPALIKDIVQVWVCSSLLPIPLALGSCHCWFVISDAENRLRRWEVWYRKLPKAKHWGYLHLDLMPPFMGMPVIPGIKLGRMPTRILKSYQGGPGLKLAEIIRSTPNTYPYSKKYVAFPGPNSNTYIQWSLNQFDGNSVILPFRALGKNWLTDQIS